MASQDQAPRIELGEVQTILNAIHEFREIVEEYEPYALAVGVTVAAVVLAILILSIISVISLYVMFYKVSHIRRKIKELDEDNNPFSKPSSIKPDEYGAVKNRFSAPKDDIETVKSYSYEDQNPRKSYGYENESMYQQSPPEKAWPAVQKANRNAHLKKSSKKSDDFY